MIDLWRLYIGCRAARTLRRFRIRTVEELIKWTPEELMHAPNFGVTSLQEITSELRKLGCELSRVDHGRLKHWHKENREYEEVPPAR